MLFVGYCSIHAVDHVAYLKPDAVGNESYVVKFTILSLAK